MRMMRYGRFWTFLALAAALFVSAGSTGCQSILGPEGDWERSEFSAVHANGGPLVNHTLLGAPALETAPNFRTRSQPIARAAPPETAKIVPPAVGGGTGP